jgi:hypothetical protein
MTAVHVVIRGPSTARPGGFVATGITLTCSRRAIVWLCRGLACVVTIRPAVHGERSAGTSGPE